MLSLGSAALAAPALQGDVCLFPAILGGLLTFFRGISYCPAVPAVQGLELQCGALGLWRSTSQTGFASVSAAVWEMCMGLGEV